MMEPVEEDRSLLIFSNSESDNSFEEIKEALISPLFLRHNFKKLSIIFEIKKILLFSINNKKKFFKLLEKFNFSVNWFITFLWIFMLWVGLCIKFSNSELFSKSDLNTFISVFPSHKPEYALLVMLENPQIAKNLIYDYRGMKIKGTRNEAGWNSVYVAGQIIKKIGPILAIKSKDFNHQYVAEKLN